MSPYRRHVGRLWAASTLILGYVAAVIYSSGGDLVATSDFVDVVRTEYEVQQYSRLVQVLSEGGPMTDSDDVDFGKFGFSRPRHVL